MNRNSLIHKLAAFLLLALAGTSYGAPGQNGRFQVFHYEQLEAEVSAAAEQTDGQRTMRFQAHGREFVISLADNRRLIGGLPDAQRERILAEIEIFSGSLENAPDSWVRLTHRGTQWQGLIWDGYEFFVIESGGPEVSSNALQKSGAEFDPIIYRLADTDAQLSDLVLEVPESMRAAPKPSSTEGGERLLEMTAAASRSIDVAAIGDFEYTDNVNGDGQPEIVGFMNSVDGIFDSQVNMQINLVEIRTFAQNNDPFSGTSVSEDRLIEVGDYKSSDPILRNLGIVHLFSGVNLDGTTIGIAFLSSICSQNAGVSLSQATNVGGPVHLTAAHEIGHNFGAPHDGDPMDACGGVVGNFLMSPSLNGSDRFSACSITEMEKVIATASCINNINPPDVQSVIPVNPVNGLTGETISYQVEVENVGGSTATNVTLDIQIPAGLVVSQADFDSGSCTLSPTLIACQRATLGPANIATATLAISGVAQGAYAISATANAANDSEPLNDDANGTINLGPATDISIDLTPADSFVQNGGSTNVTVAVTNHGPQLAQNVIVTADFSSFFTIAPGQTFASCTTNNNDQVIDCFFGDLPSGATQQVVVTVDADVSGSGIAEPAGWANTDTNDFDVSNNVTGTSISVGNRFVDIWVQLVTAPSNMQTGQTANMEMNFRNNGPDNAQDVSFTVNVGSGLGSLGITAGQIGSPSQSSNASCGGSGIAITCVLTDFIGEETFTVSFSATAAGTGTVQITSNLNDPDDFDTDSSNDNASFSVVISDPTPPPPTANSSGGGATGLVLPGLLLMLLFVRRRVM